ncbi:MAG TPA: NUDIX domain-containing protein [Phycisphaerae bacterium]|nr:NUDIX domain-containing protein [Phycisphaerae bacterium]
MPKVKANRVAVYVYRNGDNGIEFLQLHRSPGSGDYAGSWQTIYGGIKSKETAIEAAIREVKEETGLVPKEFYQVEYLESFYHRSRDRVTVLPVFAALMARNAKITLDAEHDAFRWVTAAEVSTHFVWRVQREAIDIIQRDIIGDSQAKKLLRIKVKDYLKK